MVTDPVGRWVLENVSGAYCHEGFVYCGGRSGVVIACGGDAPITVGVYEDDGAVADGDPFESLFVEAVSPAAVRAGVGFVRGWLA